MEMNIYKVIEQAKVICAIQSIPIRTTEPEDAFLPWRFAERSVQGGPGPALAIALQWAAMPSIYMYKGKSAWWWAIAYAAAAIRNHLLYKTEQEITNAILSLGCGRQEGWPITKQPK